MKKKFLAAALAVFSAASFTLAFTGCGDNEAGHTHAYTKQVAEEQFIKSVATCTEKAVYFYSCECGEKG